MFTPPAQQQPDCGAQHDAGTPLSIFGFATTLAMSGLHEVPSVAQAAPVA
jgi:hypothetical protein